MKHEWRKHEKNLYLPNGVPSLIEIPKMKYITISGVGNPNNEDFKERIKTLYSLSYAIRMMPKKGIVPDGYFEYTVYPLEGDWSSSQEFQDIEEAGLIKEDLIYTIMIRQPDFVTEEIFKIAWDLSKSKINPDHKEDVIFVETDACKAVQILHLGSYDTEPISFEKMKEYISQNGLKRTNLSWHREIYLRMDVDHPEKNRTTLRYIVK